MSAEVLVILRVEPDLLLAFDIVCQKTGTNRQETLANYMEGVVKGAKKRQKDKRPALKPKTG